MPSLPMPALFKRIAPMRWLLIYIWCCVALLSLAILSTVRW